MAIAVVVGTRPEAIKMAPVIQALQASRLLQPVVISTGQHREMLDQVFDWFGIVPDVDLRLMQPRQTLSGLMSLAIASLDEVFNRIDPEAVLVQGDTTTALAAALAAFHRQIPIGHVEAGLRTYDLGQPFPEEANRALISRLAGWHFAPTPRAVDALKKEQVPGLVALTGNTVVDALLAVADGVGEPATPLSRSRMVLITGHRRENLGRRFGAAFEAIAELAERYQDVDFVYPIHLNPRLRSQALSVLSGSRNLRLLEPVPYLELIALMKRAYLILTDSGGIQEEAPTFGVPVLVMRDTTERPEAVEAGLARLVGTGRNSIIESVGALLDDPSARAAIANVDNPFGDGQASHRIVSFLEDILGAQAAVAAV